MTTPRVTFSVPKAVLEKLVELSHATDMSVSGIANRAVMEWVEQNYKEVLAFYSKEKPVTRERWK